MPNTAEGLLIALFFILPGLQFELGMDRQVAYWRTKLSDRMPRFFGTSVVFQTLAAPLTYWAWDRYLRTQGQLRFDTVLWLLLLAYVLVPLVLGLLVGHFTGKGLAWTRWVVGRDPAPTAWDWLWSQKVGSTLYIRVRFRGGTWAVGLVDRGELRGFTSSYPEPGDIFLPRQAMADSETGEIILDEDGSPQIHAWGLLVRWDELEYLEVQEIFDGET